jgi:hypothetical protein
MSICYGHLRRQLCPSLFHGTTKTAVGSWIGIDGRPGVEIGTEFSVVAAAEQPTSGNTAVDCALVSDGHGFGHP